MRSRNKSAFPPSRALAIADRTRYCASMLKVDSLTRPPLGPVSFKLPAGAIGIVTGPSGSGKSLLARAIVDLDPNTGEVSWRGRARLKTPAPQWRRWIAYVPAETGWWADRIADHFPPDIDAARLNDLLHAVNLPRDALSWPVSRASTGERQRLAFLRALIRDPEMMILDEPTSALDAETRKRVEDVILAERRTGRTFLIITHDPAQAARLGDIFWRMENGRLAPAPDAASLVEIPREGA